MFLCSHVVKKELFTMTQSHSEKVYGEKTKEIIILDKGTVGDVLAAEHEIDYDRIEVSDALFEEIAAIMTEEMNDCDRFQAWMDEIIIEVASNFGGFKNLDDDEDDEEV